MIGIYHSRDLDGYASGAIMKLKYPDIELIGYDYGQPFNFDMIQGQPVIMADVSLPMEDMLRISELSNGQFTWIDHHTSAINAYHKFVYNNASFSCDALLVVGLAACELTWIRLFPLKGTPLGIYLLGKYDTWRNADRSEWEKVVLPFQFGVRIHCNSPETFPEELLEQHPSIASYISEGHTVLAYQTQQNAITCRRTFEADFEGLRAICVNGGGFNSEAFKSVYDESKHDLMMPFSFNGKYWVLSIYTTKDDIDCSELAKRRGGGGHKKAAGFQANDIRTVFNFI